MRVQLPLALLVAGALVLSGCSGSDDASSSSTDTTTKAGTSTRTNTTSLPPNVPPVLKLKVTDDSGNATTVTTLVQGSGGQPSLGNLTFSAEGSTDPDGDGLSAIAITVQDLNRTYPPGILYSGGAFKPVTYSFDRPGPVNITVSGIDVRGDVATLQSKVYVNLLQHLPPSPTFHGADPDGVRYKPTDCKMPDTPGENGVLADNQFAGPAKFSTALGVSHVHAKVASGAAVIAICDPHTSAAISPASDDDGETTTTKGTAFTPAVGAADYYVWMVSTDPGTPPEFNVVQVDVTVHYEPQP